MRSSSGFTLVELLVAVSLLSVLLLLLFSAMRTGIRSWEAAEHSIDAVEGISQVERFLTRIITQAQGGGAGSGGPTTWESLDPRLRKQRGLFEGEANRFLVVAPGVSAMTPGLYVYEVFLDGNSGGGGDLWVRIDPYRPEMESVGEPRLLRENVEEFSIRYFGKLTVDAEAGWMEEWPSDAGKIPWLIEIRIVGEKGLERPALVASPAIAVIE